jgi:hypothetical protein
MFMDATVSAHMTISIHVSPEQWGTDCSSSAIKAHIMNIVLQDQRLAKANAIVNGVLPNYEQYRQPTEQIVSQNIELTTMCRLCNDKRHEDI